MADKPIKGVVKAVSPAGPGWFTLSLVVEGTQYAEDYVTNVSVGAGQTITFFPKTTRQGKKMAGSPRVVQEGTGDRAPVETGEGPGPGYARKDASVCISYAKDLVVATLPHKIPLDADGEVDDAEILDRIKYLAEGMLAIQAEIAKGK